MLKSKLTNTLERGRVNFPCEDLTIHRGRPVNELYEGLDYELNSSGKVKGYLMGSIGVSTFGWKLSEKHPKHGVVNSDFFHDPCTILTGLPPSLVLHHDYNLFLRYNSGTKKQVVPHFSIFPVEDGVYSPEDWHSLIYGGREDSCQWIPCDLKAGGGDLSIPVDSDEGSSRGEIQNLINLDDGCSEDDWEYLKSSDFSVRIISLVCKYLFKDLCFHDKVMINGLLTVLVEEKPPVLRTALLGLHPHFLRSLIFILRHHKFTAATPIAYCGIAISEIEEILDPTSNSSDDEECGVEDAELPESNFRELKYYVICGHAKNVSLHMERKLVLNYTAQLSKVMYQYLPPDAEIFAAPGASIDFVVFTSADVDSIAETLPGSITFRGIDIDLDSPSSEVDLEFDHSAQCKLANLDQVEENNANAVRLSVGQDESVAVLVTNQRRSDLIKSTVQCFGARTDGSRCCNRRMPNRNKIVWCHHHRDQVIKLDAFLAGVGVVEVPEWWK